MSGVHWAASLTHFTATHFRVHLSTSHSLITVVWQALINIYVWQVLYWFNRRESFPTNQKPYCSYTFGLGSLELGLNCKKLLNLFGSGPCDFQRQTWRQDWGQFDFNQFSRSITDHPLTNFHCELSERKEHWPQPCFWTLSLPVWLKPVALMDILTAASAWEVLPNTDQEPTQQPPKHS